MPEAAEQRILDAFGDGGSWGALFRKTPCGVAYAHGEADYNGHYGVRELCDICPEEQLARCAKTWTQPDPSRLPGKPVASARRARLKSTTVPSS
jgi:hypothetical protein